jgi:GTPase SAR1 family protein
MEFGEMITNIFGPPGAGKTTNSLKLCKDHAEENGVKSPKILIINFDKDNRAAKNIKVHFKENVKQFEIINVLQRADKKNEVFERNRKSNLFKDMPGIEFKPDYYASYRYLADVVIPKLIEDISDKNYVVVDGIFPTIRDLIGVAKFLHDNPERVQPVESDYAQINPIEPQVYDTISNLCQDNGIPVIFTGKMKEDYKTKELKFGCSNLEIPHTASLTLELVKPEITKSKKPPVITVNCHKSTGSFVWADEITIGENPRSLYKILYDRYEID